MLKYKHASMKISTKENSVINCTAFSRRSVFLISIMLSKSLLILFYLGIRVFYPG